VAIGPGAPRQPSPGAPAAGVDQSNPFPIHSGARTPGISAQRAFVVGAVVAAGIILAVPLWLSAERRRSRRARRGGTPPGPPGPESIRVTHRG
jgi:hypothetical protein